MDSSSKCNHPIDNLCKDTLDDLPFTSSIKTSHKRSDKPPGRHSSQASSLFGKHDTHPHTGGGNRSTYPGRTPADYKNISIVRILYIG